MEAKERQRGRQKEFTDRSIGKEFTDKSKRLVQAQSADLWTKSIDYEDDLSIRTLPIQSHCGVGRDAAKASRTARERRPHARMRHENAVSFVERGAAICEGRAAECSQLVAIQLRRALFRC